MQVLKHKVTDELCFLIDIHGINVSVDYPNSRIAIFVIMDEPSSSWMFASENYDEFVSTYVPILPDEHGDYTELEQMRIDVSNFVISKLDHSVRKSLQFGEAEIQMYSEIPDDTTVSHDFTADILKNTAKVGINDRDYNNAQCIIIGISVILIQIFNITMWLIEPPKFDNELESLVIFGLVKSCIGIVSIIPSLYLLSGNVLGKWKSVFSNFKLLLILEILFYAIVLYHYVIALIVF